jgi:hypothetical protein
VQLQRVLNLVHVPWIQRLLVHTLRSDGPDLISSAHSPKCLDVDWMVQIFSAQLIYGCSFILPLFLLSFVTRPSNSLALRDNLRFKISPPDTISSRNLGSKDHLSGPSRLSIETMALIPYCNVPGHQSTCQATLPHGNILILIYITCILNLINRFNQTIQSKHMITANIHHQGH